MGCLRSRTERQKWNDFMPAEKMRVIEICDIRKAKLAIALKAKKEKEDRIAQGVEPLVAVKQAAVNKAPVNKAPVQQGSSISVDGQGPESSLDLF
jgi:predicted Fe-S protein YdhL (DUF1289 family)